MGRYLRTDFYRLLTSWQFYIGILGIGLLYLIGGYQVKYIHSVYDSYFYNGFFSTVIMAYAFCCIPFGGCFIEDSEHQYWIHELQKGSLRCYTWSKTITCFLSGVLTMVCGILLFVFVLRLRVPFLQEEYIVEDQRRADTFGFFIYSDSILLYFICSAVLCGMLGGILTVLSAYLSLYEKNRLFTICVSVVGFYFLENFLTSNLELPEIFNLWVIYGAGYSLFGNSCQNIVYAILVATIFVCVFGILIERKLKEEICGIQDETRVS